VAAIESHAKTLKGVEIFGSCARAGLQGATTGLIVIGVIELGIDRNRTITIEFLKAFPTAQDQPSLWTATAAMISDFVIPATVTDLRRLNSNDVCSVSGAGSLKLSGSVSVAMPVNPLASVNLPLSAGTLAIKDGVMAGLSVSLNLSGSYQIRLQKLSQGAVRP